ncbi:putative heterotrimeric G-protein GTPase [Wallemia mellicola]|uniref:Putative heterotrimeric G-protein GTPase n=1 Tax=Wallemia mellicola TaxID=1708541 RepID=A0A4T0QVH1_9BASI|nr:putative heterotrimeric G-protein GTPase [Wallemia mellicola]TIC02328.1 putative heterotrimeric G-protein GTPase [Wallemia mellicola]TIC28985.1 putative heterotrimeric G-protein GTPase [Wallemia mellicola]TIC33592.1 putative heterotrimeric G-protein GTPase [Wallemia mellicola]TIC74134.1 putative heterotrimeric G-protein GTPase [Wallemia mellicola]
MGCCLSTSSNSSHTITEKTKEIDTMLKRDFLKDRKTYKILLLGAGESGKSTIIKQMKVIYHSKKPFTLSEVMMYRQQIYSNIINGLWIAIDCAYEQSLSLLPQNEEFIDEFLETIPKLFDYTTPPPVPISGLKDLWSDASIQRVFKDAHGFAIPENLSYWFDNLDRVMFRDYIPNVDDILTCRAKSIGISENNFHIGGYDYRIFDVGGQRSERKKWIHCFEGVTTIIFVIALSSYDQALEEDLESNQMQESLLLFDSICNSRWFIRTSLIVFLNKNDIFKEQIKNKPLREVEYFNDYQGKNEDVDASRHYLKQRVLSLNKNRDKEIYVHTTNAKDTKNLSRILVSVTDIILKENLNLLMI